MTDPNLNLSFQTTHTGVQHTDNPMCCCDACLPAQLLSPANQAFGAAVQGGMADMQQQHPFPHSMPQQHPSLPPQAPQYPPTLMAPQWGAPGAYVPPPWPYGDYSALPPEAMAPPPFAPPPLPLPLMNVSSAFSAPTVASSLPMDLSAHSQSTWTSSVSVPADLDMGRMGQAAAATTSSSSLPSAHAAGGRKPAGAGASSASSPAGGPRWTDADDQKLREGVDVLGNWPKSSGLNKGPWTPEEDQIVKSMVESYGSLSKVSWSEIGKRIGRVGKRCRERWVNHLRPSIRKGDWTEEEDRIVYEAQKTFGNKWSEIAKLLTGRTENQVKNRWNSSAMKRLAQSESATSSSIPAGPSAGSLLPSVTSSSVPAHPPLDAPPPHHPLSPPLAEQADLSAVGVTALCSGPAVPLPAPSAPPFRLLRQDAAFHRSRGPAHTPPPVGDASVGGANLHLGILPHHPEEGQVHVKHEGPGPMQHTASGVWALGTAHAHAHAQHDLGPSAMFPSPSAQVPSPGLGMPYDPEASLGDWGTAAAVLEQQDRHRRDREEQDMRARRGMGQEPGGSGSGDPGRR